MSYLSLVNRLTARILVVGAISIFASNGISALAQDPTQVPDKVPPQVTDKLPAQVKDRLPGQVVDKASVTAKATIDAIDQTNRLITLKLENGDTAVVKADPSMKRFNELKVGDVVTATYTQSLAVRVRKPGEPEPVREKATITPREGKPGVTGEYEQTATVTIQEIDNAVPSVKVKADDGTVMSFRVRDPSRLQGVKVGDKVDITYTQAVLLNADTPSPQ